MILDDMHKNGIITKGIGGFYYVDCGEKIVECHARGKFRNKDLSPIVGDKVKVLINEDGTGSICEIYERKNFLVRPEVANIDAIILVSAARSPMPDLLLTDKLLVTAESKGIECIICLNKTDLADKAEVEAFTQIYQKAGYKILTVCAAENEGIDEIESIVCGKTVAFAGLSGVGKSSIIKSLTGIDLKTGDVSRLERGRHTTRHVELISTCGGFVFDTPGFSRFDADELFACDLWQYFPEIRKRHGRCKFRTCTHRSEPGCVVSEACMRGEIAESRLENYKLLYNKLIEIKDWQRKDVHQ